MPSEYHFEKRFEKLDTGKQELPEGEYEHCIFEHCYFNGADLSGFRFIETEFIECDLSNTKLEKTAFQEVIFANCKMLGLHFEACHDFAFGVRFEKCVLNHASFFQMKLNRTSFIESQLRGVDFTEADLKGIALTGCDLLDATFENTNLEKTDLRNAFNYSIDPELNRIRGAKFTIPEVTGLLTKYQIQIDD